MVRFNFKKSRLSLLLLALSSIVITSVSAAIYYQISASMTLEAEVSPVIFTSGEDTSTCSGTISTNATQVTFTNIPLAVESNITITQLVNITNTDNSDHTVTVSVTENFNTEISALSLYLVSPSGSETLVVSINDSGTITVENVSVNIPLGEEWAIKLEGCYDSGTSSTQSNTMTMNLQVTG